MSASFAIRKFTVTDHVQAVRSRCIPPQIGKCVIVRVVVEMTPLHPVRAWAYESKKHDMMQLELPRHTLARKRRHPIAATTFRRLLLDPRLKLITRTGVLRPAREHPPLVRHRVAFPTGNVSDRLTVQLWQRRHCREPRWLQSAYRQLSCPRDDRLPGFAPSDRTPTLAGQLGHFLPRPNAPAKLLVFSFIHTASL